MTRAKANNCLALESGHVRCTPVGRDSEIRRKLILRSLQPGAFPHATQVPAAKADTKARSRRPVFQKGSWSIFCCAWLFVFATASRASALALETDHTIEQFIHTSWGTKEGAPVNIKAMAQTADGYLWLGVLEGLFRFDGTVFEHYEPQTRPALPAGPVTALLGLPNGDLWIGYYSGAIALLRNGRVQNYTKSEGVPDGHLWSFAQDRQGTIWAGTNAGLARFEGDRWKQVGRDWNFPWKSAKAIFVDHKGTLWVAADNTIAFLPEGTRAFQSTSIQVGHTLQFAEAANGKLWMAETTRSVRPIPLADTLSPSDETEVRVGARSILFDREGSLWIPTLGDGIRRISAPEQLQGKPGRFDSPVEQYMKKDGLSDDTAVTILQDRDGNIWVGTMLGIDRFRRSGLVPVRLPLDSFSPVLVPGSSGDAWAFPSAMGAFHIDKSRVDKVENVKYPVNSGYRDSKGAIWVITIGNLMRFEKGRFYWFLLPKELPIPSALGLKITEDRSGVLWLAAEEWGLYRRENGQWSRVETPPDIAKLLPTSAFTDEQGRVWFSYFPGVVVALDEGKLQIFRLEESPSLNHVYAVQGRNKHLWIGTTLDLLFFDGSQFHAIAPADQPKFLDVTGIKELADGSLWLCEKRGIVHIDAAEVRRFLEMPSHRVHYEVFDSLDGIQGTFLHTGEKLIEASDHHLWFASSKNIVWLDPAIPRNFKPLSNLIKYLTADGQQFPLGSDLSLPPRIGNLQIGYAAVDLSVPERVHYRYKLDGMDKDWQDVGIRREAFYTNLGPGKYKFHMAARHDGEEWSTEEAVLDFRIAPAWFQTIWFRSFCICVFLFLLWTLYQLRLKQLERQFNRTLEARVAERTRIARELHDTLLQTFSALLLRLQSVSKILPTRPEEARQRVDGAIEQASSAIAEGRDAVRELRSEGPADDLAQTIGNFGRELLSGATNENPPELRVHVGGTPRSLNPMVRDEAYRIAVEALRNSMRHAGARQIEAEIQYDVQQLRLRICDDGKGIDPGVLEQGHVAGHWGLRGMRERARLLGGNFEVWSKVGSGTEIELTIPAAKAYTKAGSRWPVFLKGWWSIFCCAWLFVFATASRASALDPTSRISQYGHTVWRVQDGYFGGTPLDIAQTKDGYIWVGTDAGLFKFDGVRFVQWSSPHAGEELPSSGVMNLASARDGSLWIGTDAGLAHLVNDRLILYQKDEGWQISGLMEDRDGKIWLRQIRSDDKTHSLCQVVDNEVHCYGNKDGVTTFSGSALAQDTSGDLWVGGDTNFVRWRPGASKGYQPKVLQSNEGNAGVSMILPMADGSVWIGIAVAGRGGGLQHMVDGVSKPFSAPKLNGETLQVTQLYSDHQNNLWVGTTHGLYRIHGMDVDHYGSEQGLSADFVNKIFEDREGNLWVSTSQGLDMFRDLRVKSISKREGLNEDGANSVAATLDGSVWIGTDRLQVLGPHGISFGPAKELPGDIATSLFQDHAGRLWAGMINKLFILEKGRFRQVTRRNGSPVGMVMGITEDTEHNIWIESAGPPGALLQIRDTSVQKEFPESEMPLARKIVADPKGGIWLGLVTGDLAHYRDGQMNIVTFGPHPNSRVLALTAAPDGSILGATIFGVIGWKNGKQQLLTMRNGLPCDTVNQLASDNSGNLWLHAQCGLIEISNEQMQLWWEHPESKLSLRVFDISDGVQPGLGHFSASTRTPDGRIWFANGNLVQVIDPAHLPTNNLAPPLDISALIADRKAYSMESLIRLPPLTRNLEIDYTALSYVVPQKVLFRYRLEGHDTTWQEPGTRRQAFYSDLGPGSYKFKVIACNNDGVWNNEGATLDFYIAPAWFQTVWFRAFCLCVFLFLIWSLYQLRLRALERQFNTTLETRVAERTRIARELHDTLLQSFSALLLRLQSVSKILPTRAEDAKQRVDGAIEQASSAIAEGRDAVHELRSEGPADDDLAQAICNFGRELLSGATDENTPGFRVHVEGSPRSLNPMVRDEAYRIAVEALRNAVRYAGAKQIEAEIQYDAQQVRLRIRDDGKGIDPGILEQGHAPGHWGLRGMRERAKLLGGKFEVWSEVDSGTEIELTVPAASAYAKPASRWTIFLRRRRN